MAKKAKKGNERERFWLIFAWKEEGQRGRASLKGRERGPSPLFERFFFLVREREKFFPGKKA